MTHEGQTKTATEGQTNAVTEVPDTWRQTLAGDVRLRLFRELFTHMVIRNDQPADPDAWLDGTYAISKWDIPEERAVKELNQFKFDISDNYKHPMTARLRKPNNSGQVTRIIMLMASQIGFTVGTGTRTRSRFGPNQNKQTFISYRQIMSWDKTKILKNKHASGAEAKKKVAKAVSKPQRQRRKPRVGAIRLSDNKKELLL